MPFGITIVPTAKTGIRTHFGQAVGHAKPGLNFYIPYVQKIIPISNRLTQESFKFSTKTKDNVFAGLGIAVQFRIKEENSMKAHYSLDDPIGQLNSYIKNCIQATVPDLTLDELFKSQHHISRNVLNELSKEMSEYGYTIENALVTSIEPPKEVVDAMNKINASQRLKEASKNDADAEYIKKVREAEADKDRKILQGQGTSGQRLEILKGYQHGVDKMAKDLGLLPEEIIQFVIKTQYMDAMESIAKSPNAKVIFVGNSEKDNEFLKNLIKAKEA